MVNKYRQIRAQVLKDSVQINLLQPSGFYMYHQVSRSEILHSVLTVHLLSVWFLEKGVIICL